ncbi:gamma-glutamyltransferase [Nitrococcus mobilis]|uniref:Glutathione hydrolase proenzyme n=1 Tax=Nitrococcus mobilis Nb-231 TaxID=314278 RepID=A4BP15_9GAMM|nr:gamma-glutamyltransferase [Nitrococcus mobilis]EAR22316.1 Gamma-glutamyltransferase [Nitrococcus mobilis Nb-231]
MVQTQQRWLIFVFVSAVLSSSGSLSLAATGPGRAAVASAHPLATQAALEVLSKGGNAFDAAVAASAALAVVEPASSGLGGGGFWLLHVAASGRDIMVDGRERAPLAATRDMYLGSDGKVKAHLSLDGPLAAAIPGEPAALVHIAEHYGRLPLAESLRPAIRYARQGFAVDAHYYRLAQFRQPVLKRYRAAAAVFLQAGGVPKVGWMLRQPDLAVTLGALAEAGRAGFYEGEIARRLVRAVRAAGGIWSLEDLKQYRVVEREPVRLRYRGLNVVTAALPSAGGLQLAIMLNILAGYDLGSLDKAHRIHLVVEAMRRSYRTRARYLGDPDFVAVPRRRLASAAYASALRQGIELNHATRSTALGELSDPPGQGADTTHFSIIDAAGNRVSATLSINYPFGSGFVAAGTGVVLNDEMDDFATHPGESNVYGLVGGEANAIAPGKRPLSSMSPAFVETPQRIGVLGTPGGSRIVSMVLLGILGFADGQPPAVWVSRARYHHQYLPDAIQYEPDAFGAQLRERLAAMGHRFEPLTQDYGNMQAILWERRGNRLQAASDPRGNGSARVTNRPATIMPGD